MMNNFQHIPTLETQIDNITQTVVTVTNASAVILTANAERKHLEFRSQGTGTTAVYIKLAAVAATTTNARELLDAETWVVPYAYTGEVRAITASGNKTLYIEEWY